MQTEQYNKIWTKKKNGYYQSTTNFEDRTRHWLHQEVYKQEVGELKVGYCIHHIDENKDNNTSTNLEQITNSLHSTQHVNTEERLTLASQTLKKGNYKKQLLAQAARRGEYVGVQAARRLNKGTKSKMCEYCNITFTLKDTDRNDSKYCSYICCQRASKTNRYENYVPLAESLKCIVCSIEYVPVVGNQVCCSKECCKVNTELKRKQNVIKRICSSCGEEFETIKSSKKKYCSVSCRN
jgi:hypothetical protein